MLTSLAVDILQVWAAIKHKPVQDTTSTTNDSIEDDTNAHDTKKGNTNKDDSSPAVESPEVTPKPIATPAAAAKSSNDTQGLQDNNTPTAIQATPAAAAPAVSNDSQGLQDSITPNQATATATVSRRRAKAAPKPLQDYSLLAPSHIRQLKVDYWKKHQEKIAALKACRLQFENCRWYQQAYN
jgi:hypothetical protein